MVPFHVFEPQHKKSAVDIVINNIRKLILSKKLKSGDKLPSESELCERLSVSRCSLREAIKTLSAVGIVQVRQGDGTYITQSAQKVIFDPVLFSLMVSQTDFSELIELREFIEMTLVRLVTKNASDENIALIHRAYRDMEKVVNDPQSCYKDHYEFDLKFHISIASATGNNLITNIYSLILEFFKSSIEETYIKNEQNGKNALKTHWIILDAIMKRDVGLAEQAVINSNKNWKESYLD